MKLIPAFTTFAVAVSVFLTVFPDFFPVTLTGYTKVVVSLECCIYAGFRIILVHRIISIWPYDLSGFPSASLDFLAVAPATPSKIRLAYENSYFVI